MPTDATHPLRCNGIWKGEKCDRYLGEATGAANVVVLCPRCGTRNAYEFAANSKSEVTADTRVTAATGN